MRCQNLHAAIVESDHGTGLPRKGSSHGFGQIRIKGNRLRVFQVEMSVTEQKNVRVSLTARQSKLPGLSKTLVLTVCVDNLREGCRLSPFWKILTVTSGETGNGFNQARLALGSFAETLALFGNRCVIQHVACGTHRRKGDQGQDRD